MLQIYRLLFEKNEPPVPPVLQNASWPEFYSLLATMKREYARSV